ncbi:helix-turn-helix domain-containing protein [Priestia megaterium]|uniref:helix-turn-helix domain-containing protein n=1 Tax=Priestia megaterium TaxID=1404 RepID=UPI003D26A26C
MENSLLKLVNKAKENNHYMEQLIKKFEPKIKKSLFQTNLEEREDLYQELSIKFINCVHASKELEVPGFFEFFDNVRR